MDVRKHYEYLKNDGNIIHLAIVEINHTLNMKHASEKHLTIEKTICKNDEACGY